MVPLSQKNRNDQQRVSKISIKFPFFENMDETKSSLNTMIFLGKSNMLPQLPSV